ncbi:hypothetical protein HanXRQr2_Chr12g0530241 [Helianthus annuus]|uniref:Uncharacterized protein n=1 Tax=Helianthus annuus TaxID=4232 RepID=A0A9K3ENR5_HELAN|nr:hypothetical protein HanXRQr2_Chr12g0530241 [Helianthus annuus]KAJ0861817.1 hypothetical protein HanPSC8_Chr12g0510911 [Helianthus annuus]
MVDLPGTHFSFCPPDHVFRRLKQTLPQLYRFGLMRRPPEWRCIRIGAWKKHVKEKKTVVIRCPLRSNNNSS